MGRDADTIAAKPGTIGVVRRQVRLFARDACGAALVTFALIIPILLVSMVVVVDLARGFNIKQQLQAAADAAALAAASELSMTGSSRRAEVSEVVKSYLARYAQGSSEYEDIGSAEVDVTVSDDPIEVSVALTLRPQLLMGAIIESWTAIKSTSVARVVGKPNICMLALEPSEPAAIILQQKARWSATTVSCCRIPARAAALRC